MNIVTFLLKNGDPAKRVVDFPLERDTFRNKIMEIVDDFDEKSCNNNGKPWKSSRILRMNPNCFIFSFFSFSHFFIFSFFLIFSFFHLFPFFSFFLFSFIFFHFLSCSFMFFHVLSCSFMFFHVLSCSFMFFHVLSFLSFFLCWVLKI